MNKVTVDYTIRGRYEDSNGKVTYMNRQSKKAGETLRKASVSMEWLNYRSWLHKLHRDTVRHLFNAGFHDRVITNRRKDFIESDGKMGISKAEALEWYRYIYRFLTAEDISLAPKPFDNFTLKELEADT